MNEIAVIAPYKWNGWWVFDDDRVGLVREPFIAGADTMIDLAIEKSEIEEAEEGFLLFFSANQFVGADICLQWIGDEGDGNSYLWAEKEQRGWLCPALLLYFDAAPKNIYVRLANKKE